MGTVHKFPGASPHPMLTREELFELCCNLLRDQTVIFSALESVAQLCIYRINRLCWEKCKARDLCQPEKNGLITVNDIYCPSAV